MGVDESSKPAGLAAHAHSKKFGEVFAAETRHLHPKEDRQVTGRAPCEIPQAGLALSGGGIRSAAFALGVVQALEAEKCFAGFDYLSSVSGGGYTGAGLIAGLYRGDGAFPFSTTESGADLEAADVADNAAVGKIRDHSRYLMPNGIFDLVVSFGVILRGLAVSAVDVAAVVTLCAAVMLLAKPTEASLDASFVLSVIGYWSPVLSSGLEQHLGVSFVGTKLLGLFLFCWLVAVAIVRSFIAEAERTSDTAQIDRKREFRRTFCQLVL